MEAFLYTALLFVGAIVIYSAFIETNWVTIRRVRIDSNRLAHTIGHLRIIHISDLHIRTIGYREKKTIKIVNNLDPDLIFITGDLVAFKRKLTIGFDFLNQLMAKQGIWVVLGNSDYSEGDYSKKDGKSTITLEHITKKLSKNNSIHLLNNANETITFPQLSAQSISPRNNNGNTQITIIGLDDPVTYRDNAMEALDRIPEENTKILLTHYQNFRITSDMIERVNSLDLILSGHTHGGQIFFLKFAPSFLKQWYFKRKMDREIDGVGKEHIRRTPAVFKGLYRQGETIGYINSGLGTSFLPIRFGVRPEIAILEFST